MARMPLSHPPPQKKNRKSWNGDLFWMLTNNPGNLVENITIIHVGVRNCNSVPDSVRVKRIELTGISTGSEMFVHYARRRSKRAARLHKNADIVINRRLLAPVRSFLFSRTFRQYAFVTPSDGHSSPPSATV